MTQEAKRGLILIAWACAVWRLPSMRAIQFYDRLAELVEWLGTPQTVYGVAGVLIGALAVVAAERDWQVMRRALAIFSVAYWLLVGSGFAGASPALPATIMYFGFACLHVQTAMGRPPR